MRKSPSVNLQAALVLLAALSAAEGAITLGAVANEANLLGYSPSRLALLAALSAGTLGLLWLGAKARRSSTWAEGLAAWTRESRWLWILSIAGMLAGWAVLMLAPYELLPRNFRYQAYYDQLRPVIYWGMLLCAQAAFWRLLVQAAGQAEETAPAQSPRGRRYLFVDAARSFAIAVVLFAHGFTAMKMSEQIGLQATVRIFDAIRWATPAFVMLYGMMIEIVYGRKADREGLRSVVPRLLTRSLQCYLGYLATVAAMLTSGIYGWQRALMAALFVDVVWYSNILKFYTLLLLLTIPLLWLRKRIGLKATLALWVSPWLLIPWLYGLPWVKLSDPTGVTQPIAYVTSLLTGFPQGLSEFSLLHSTVVVAIGMLLGRRLVRAEDPDRPREFYRTTSALIGVCAAITLFWVFFYPGGDLLRDYAIVLKSDHHLAYYSISVGGALIVLLLFAWAIPPTTPYTKRFAPLLTLGRETLWAFSLGNVIAVSWRWGAPPTVWLSLLYLLVFIVVVQLVIEGKNWAKGRWRRDELGGAEV